VPSIAGHSRQFKIRSLNSYFEHNVPFTHLSRSKSQMEPEGSNSDFNGPAPGVSTHQRRLGREALVRNETV
jgi:hypothetical protein